MRVLTKVFTRTYFSEYVVLVVVVLSSKSPNGAILFHSPGRKPWVNRSPHPLSSVGAALPQSQHKRPHPHNNTNQTCVLKVPFLKELNLLLSVCTQGGMRAKPDMEPWAMQECRPKGLIYVSPPTQLLCCFEVVCVGRSHRKDKFYLFFYGALQNAAFARS